MVPREDKVRSVMSLVRDIEWCSLQRTDECCGFGGTFAVNEPDVSAMMGRDRVADHPHLKWRNLSEMLKAEPVDTIHVPWFVSWADQDRDTSAWLGNRMQQTAFETAKSLEKKVKETEDEKVLETWRKLMTSDHFYYMSTKFAGDEEVHSYFRSEVYENPYEAFANFMNILQDFKMELDEKLGLV